MSYKKFYQTEVELALRGQQNIPVEILDENSMLHIPLSVQKYLRFAGAVGKPKIKNVFIAAIGKIRSKPDDPWMNFTSEQYNFYPDPRRYFYIKALKAGIPAYGLHLYKNETATMQIKLAGIFQIVDAKGTEMNQGETVTVFNDMCFMAPGTLIDKNIAWEELDSLHVKATYTNGRISISAILTFDEEGRLVDFISQDRFETADGKKYMNNPWRTPVIEYGSFNGFRLPSKADVIYVRPEGEFCYGKFELKEIKYNV